MTYVAWIALKKHWKKLQWSVWYNSSQHVSSFFLQRGVSPPHLLPFLWLTALTHPTVPLAQWTHPPPSCPLFDLCQAPFFTSTCCSSTLIECRRVVGRRFYWPQGCLFPQVSSTQNNKASDPSTPAAKARVSPRHVHPHTRGHPPTFSHYMHRPSYIHPPRRNSLVSDSNLSFVEMTVFCL